MPTSTFLCIPSPQMAAAEATPPSSPRLTQENSQEKEDSPQQELFPPPVETFPYSFQRPGPPRTFDLEICHPQFPTTPPADIVAAFAEVRTIGSLQFNEIIFPTKDTLMLNTILLPHSQPQSAKETLNFLLTNSIPPFPNMFLFNARGLWPQEEVHLAYALNTYVHSYPEEAPQPTTPKPPQRIPQNWCVLLRSPHLILHSESELLMYFLSLDPTKSLQEVSRHPSALDVYFLRYSSPKGCIEAFNDFHFLCFPKFGTPELALSSENPITQFELDSHNDAYMMHRDSPITKPWFYRQPPSFYDTRVDPLGKFYLHTQTWKDLLDQVESPHNHMFNPPPPEDDRFWHPDGFPTPQTHSRPFMEKRLLAQRDERAQRGAFPLSCAFPTNRNTHGYQTPLEAQYGSSPLPHWMQQETYESPPPSPPAPQGPPLALPVPTHISTVGYTHGWFPPAYPYTSPDPDYQYPYVYPCARLPTIPHPIFAFAWTNPNPPLDDVRDTQSDTPSDATGPASYSPSPPQTLDHIYHHLIPRHTVIPVPPQLPLHPSVTACTFVCPLCFLCNVQDTYALCPRCHLQTRYITMIPSQNFFPLVQYPAPPPNPDRELQRVLQDFLPPQNPSLRPPHFLQHSHLHH